MWDPFEDDPQEPNPWVRGLTVLAATAVALAILLSPTVRARAQERGADHDGHVTGHAKYHDEYSHWCQPDYPNCMETKNHGQSCCDARVVVPAEDGKEPVVTGHCYPTTFLLNPKGNTTWIARLSPEDQTFEGEGILTLDGHKWIEVPDERLVNRYKNPDPTGEAGHLCTNHDIGWIICGRQPNLGG